MLSPLLGRFTAEQFHKLLVGRICAKCEEKAMRREPHSITKYVWKNKQYDEVELFRAAGDEVGAFCKHYRGERSLDHTRSTRN